MSVDTYKFDISRATDAATLHAYQDDAKEDETLTDAQREEVFASINARFCELNRAAIGQQKPRW